MDVIPVSSGTVRMIWPQVVGWLEPAMEVSRGMYTPHGVVASLEAQTQQLWAILDGDDIIGAAVTAVADREDGRRVLECQLVGAQSGKWDGWVEAMDAAMDGMAKRCRCDEISLAGRRGWVRAIREYGYNETCVVVTKEVNHGDWSNE